MNAQSNIGSFFLLFAFAAVIVGIAVFSLTRAKRVLRRWVDSGGFEILESEARYLSTGAFKSWQVSRGQYIYFVRVRDKAGHQRSGWVRCGSFFGGVMFCDEAEVRWDEL